MAAFEEVPVRVLIQAGLIHPPLELTKTYKGKLVTASVEADGTVTYNGQSYSSLSTAASAARQTVLGRPVNTNGWNFWRFRDTDGRVKQVDELRRRYRERATPESEDA